MYPAGDDLVTSRYVALPDGERVFVAECGPTDGMPVVLCHGWGACVYSWVAMMPVLAAAGYRAVAFDLRGHGRSDEGDPRSCYTTPAMTAQLAAVISTLGIDRPVLVGHSMSGRITLQYTLDDPRRVRGLVLLAPNGVGTLRPGFRQVAELVLALGARLGPVIIRRALVRLVVWAVSGRLRRTPERDIDEYWAPSQWGKYARAIHALIRDFDWRALGADVIASLPVPVLIVLGEIDPLLRVPDRDALAARLGTRRVVTIPRAGHIVNEEAPALVNAELLALLALVASRD